MSEEARFVFELVGRAALDRRLEAYSEHDNSALESHAGVLLV